ncbi:MAG: carbonic anhydrase [Bacteroides sp.]|nr:carbonic anhydrase [Eubacterium sp.]MCM1419507.1 carbonic anhydrase [Roseburia sp.]MCM1463268.1 carbonic anhydrase [Bacteroides sp.]
MVTEFLVKPEEALERLIEGNKRYISSRGSVGDISPERRSETVSDGQHPYAIIVSCSDSRVIPEVIFSAGIGDLFVIRIAGNVIDDHQLGSIEYAAEHLGAGLLVILAHDHCGAVDAALHHEQEGYIKFITDEIERAIGDERDEYKACCLNAEHSKKVIEESLRIQSSKLKVMTAIYRLESGAVEFF